MTSRHLRNSLTAVLAFTVAAALIAADGDNGKFKRRGGNGNLKTGTFQIVVPKADRGGSKGNVAKFVAPKADRGGRQVAKFVAPKTGVRQEAQPRCSRYPQRLRGPVKTLRRLKSWPPRLLAAAMVRPWRRPRTAMDWSLPRPSSRSSPLRNYLRLHRPQRPSRPSRPFRLLRPLRPRPRPR